MDMRLTAELDTLKENVMILVEDKDTKTNKLEKIDGKIRKINETIAENSDVSNDLGDKLENWDNKMNKTLERLEKMKVKIKKLEEDGELKRVKEKERKNE